MNPSLNTTVNSKATYWVAFFFGPFLRVFLCVLLLSGLLVQGAQAETWRVGVKAVVDGDTLVLAGGERLRLRGIDAPEMSRSGGGQYYGQEARDFLFALVFGRDILLDRRELGTDRYGRLVGLVSLDDGRLVNLLMVEAGAAFVYPHSSDRDRALARRMLAAQTMAMEQGLGFWPALFSSPAAQAGFVGTKNSKRFHVLSCAQGHKIGAANRVYFSSLRDAFAAGYAPARECTPWPAKTGF